MSNKQEYLNNCRSCWWQEGGRCYEGEYERFPDGMSAKHAVEKCEKYWNKRTALSSIIPNDKLVIVSEKRNP